MKLCKSEQKKRVCSKWDTRYILNEDDDSNSENDNLELNVGVIAEIASDQQFKMTFFIYSELHEVDHHNESQYFMVV